jgi:hypothetical protein
VSSQPAPTGEDHAEEERHRGEFPT